MLGRTNDRLSPSMGASVVVPVIALVGAFLLLSFPANAAVTITADATNGWFPVDGSSAIAPVATTVGRAEVCNVFLGVAVEDPLRTCALGNTRTIPPTAMANGTPLGLSFASVVANGPGTKRLRVFATQFTRGILNLDPATNVTAAAIDPIDYAVLPAERIAGIGLTIESLSLTSNPDKP